MAKHGLVVSYYFPPGGGGGVQRWLKLIKYLNDFDWHITVITSAPEPNQPTDQSLMNEIPRETRVITVSAESPISKMKFLLAKLVRRAYWQRWLSAFFHITDSRGDWNIKVKKIILEEIARQHPDVLILSAPPYSLAELAAEFNRTLPVPVVFDLRDPWTINPYKIHPTFFHRFIDRRREYRTISLIGSLSVTYQRIIDDYSQRIPNFRNKNINYLPNGYDEADFIDLKPVSLNKSADFRIGFSGSFYSHLNTPGLLFAALAALKSRNVSVEFHHIGTSVHNLEKMAASFGIRDAVIEWGYKPHRECLAILNQMNAFCLILEEGCPNSRNTVGGKFYEYLRLKKPIIALVPEKGEAARMIRETDSGLVISGREPKMIASMLSDLINRKYRFTWQGIEKYSREKQASDLNVFLNSLIK